MNENHAVIHFNNPSMTEATKYKLEQIIDENIRTYEEYFCCEGEEQTCYFKGTKEECENFRNEKEEDVKSCMKVVECNN